MGFGEPWKEAALHARGSKPTFSWRGNLQVKIMEVNIQAAESSKSAFRITIILGGSPSGPGWFCPGTRPGLEQHGKRSPCARVDRREDEHRWHHFSDSGPHSSKDLGPHKSRWQVAWFENCHRTSCEWGGIICVEKSKSVDRGSVSTCC